MTAQIPSMPTQPTLSISKYLDMDNNRNDEINIAVAATKFSFIRNS